MKPFKWIIVWARQEPITTPRHLLTLSSSWSVLSWPHHSQAPCFPYEVTCIANALPCLGDELTMDTIKRRFLQVLKHSPNDKSEIRTTAAVEDQVSPKRSEDGTSVMDTQWGGISTSFFLTNARAFFSSCASSTHLSLKWMEILRRSVTEKNPDVQKNTERRLHSWTYIWVLSLNSRSSSWGNWCTSHVIRGYSGTPGGI